MRAEGSGLPVNMSEYCVPSAWNICSVKSGKAAAKELRMAEFAAIALAATGRKASTRSVGRGVVSEWRRSREKQSKLTEKDALKTEEHANPERKGGDLHARIGERS